MGAYSVVKGDESYLNSKAADDNCKLVSTTYNRIEYDVYTNGKPMGYNHPKRIKLWLLAFLSGVVIIAAVVIHFTTNPSGSGNDPKTCQGVFEKFQEIQAIKKFSRRTS